MSYEPNEWAKGDVVTSAKLNHIENGIAGAGTAFIVNVEVDEQTGKDVFDKTWKEIHDAIISGHNVLIIKEHDEAGMHIEDYDYIQQISVEPDVYYIQSFGGYSYETDSENGYPVSAN